MKDKIKIGLTVCVLGILLQIFFTNALGVFFAFFKNLGDSYQATMSDNFERKLSTVAYVVLLAPLIEELIFRFGIFKISKFIFSNFLVANCIQAVLFGIYHMNPVQGVYAFILGFYIGWIMEITGNFLYAILLHAIINAGGLLINLITYEIGIPIRIVLICVSLGLTVYLSRELYLKHVGQFEASEGLPSR